MTYDVWGNVLSQAIARYTDNTAEKVLLDHKTITNVYTDPALAETVLYNRKGLVSKTEVWTFKTGIC